MAPENFIDLASYIFAAPFFTTNLLDFFIYFELYHAQGTHSYSRRLPALNR